MKTNHNAIYVNLTRNMRNSHQIALLSKAFSNKAESLQISTQQMCFPNTNVIGNQNVYYTNIYGIHPGLLAVAAVNKYFPDAPKESIVILFADLSSQYFSETYDLINKHFSSNRPITRDFNEYIKNPEGILVTSIEEFQGAQARNIIIFDVGTDFYLNARNAILRTMSFAIVILNKKQVHLSSSVALEDKNLHEYIYPEGGAPECLHYHNKDKHDISSMTMAILDKYKLLDKDEGIVIVTYKRISKDIMREANTKKFLSLPVEKRKDIIEERIASENKELYEDVKRNIDRKYAGISWSYIIRKDPTCKIKITKPRHITYVVIDYYRYKSMLYELSQAKNMIVFADENIDHKHEFAAWGGWRTLEYSDNKTSINIDHYTSKESRNVYNAFCINMIMMAQPEFALIVHDEKFDVFNSPKGALNLIEDTTLDEYIPVEDNKGHS